MEGFNRPTLLVSSGLYACNRLEEDFPGQRYSWFHDDAPWPLLRRAWVFQERRLSPRVLHFSANQLVWECRSTQQSVTGDINDNWTEPDWHLPFESDSFEEAEYPFRYPYDDTGNAWQRVVSEYSHLKLTYASDRLPAIAAIVERTMRARKDDNYIAGMWESSLLVDFAWYGLKYWGNPKRSDDSKPT